MTDNFSFDDIKEKFKNNKFFKIASISLSAILIGVVVFLGYRQFIWKPDNEKSKDAYYESLNYILKDQDPNDTTKAPKDPIKQLQGAVKNTMVKLVEK